MGRIVDGTSCFRHNDANFMSTYQTLSNSPEALYKDKGSKFLGFATGVKHEDDIRQFLDKIKNLHPKATHHCYAWRLGRHKNLFRANDDGEPAGSAGKPILNTIDSAQLSDCIIVVVRYYGGTPLGVPGLIHAYKETAKNCLEKAERIAVVEMTEIQLQCDYPEIQKVYQWVQIFDGKISDQQMNETCTFKIEIPAERQTDFRAQAEKFYPVKIIDKHISAN